MTKNWMIFVTLDCGNASL